MTRREYLAAKKAWDDKLQAEADRITKKFLEHRETVKLSKDDFKGAFDYVQNLFPRIAPVLESTSIYKNENTYFAKITGIPKGVAGFFMKPTSTIIILYNPFPHDIVVVHEMLHYCSQLMGSRMRSTEMEEDFAYIKSIPYIRSRGFDDEWIVKKYLISHYKGLEMGELAHGGKLSKAMKDEADRLALERCKTILKADLGEMIPHEEPRENNSRFDI